jgi:uncharacterized membrane protein
LGDDAKKIEPELKRIKMNLGIIRVRCDIILQHLAAITKVLTQFPITAHVVVKEDKVVTYTNFPAVKPIVLREVKGDTSKDNLIIFLIVVIVILVGVVLSIIIVGSRRKVQDSVQDRVREPMKTTSGKNVAKLSTADKSRKEQSGHIGRQDTS